MLIGGISLGGQGVYPYNDKILFREAISSGFKEPQKGFKYFSFSKFYL